MSNTTRVKDSKMSEVQILFNFNNEKQRHTVKFDQAPTLDEFVKKIKPIVDQRKEVLYYVQLFHEDENVGDFISDSKTKLIANCTYNVMTNVTPTFEAYNYQSYIDFSFRFTSYFCRCRLLQVSKI